MGHIAEREHADRLAVLDARFPGDEPRRHGAAVDSGAVAGLAGGQPVMPSVILRRVAPPTSSPTAVRYSSGVVQLSGSMLLGSPAMTHPPSGRVEEVQGPVDDQELRPGPPVPPLAVAREVGGGGELRAHRVGGCLDRLREAGLARGLALRRAWRLSEVFMILLRNLCVVGATSWPRLDWGARRRGHVRGLASGLFSGIAGEQVPEGVNVCEAG
jgi:hypothetical protein